MKYVTRQLETTLLKAARAFPAIVLTGPRRAGKTHLLKHRFPKAGYWLLEDPDLCVPIPRAFWMDCKRR
jgi:hypothetical protein